MKSYTKSYTNIEQQNKVHENHKTDAIAILRNHGLRVADIEDSFGYKKAGNHFLVSRECGNVKTVRLIADTQIGRTGNFFIEIEHHRYNDESKEGTYEASSSQPLQLMFMTIPSYSISTGKEMALSAP